MHLTSQYGSSPSQYPIRDSWRPRQLQRLLASQKPSFTSTLSHGPGGCSPGSVHPDNVQVAEVHAFLVKPGIAGASTKTQVGASALGCRGWRFHGGSCLALPCTQEEERERWRGGQDTWPAWVRGPAGLLLLHNKEVGTLGAQEPLASPGKPQLSALRLHAAVVAPTEGSPLCPPIGFGKEAPSPWRRHQ